MKSNLLFTQLWLFLIFSIYIAIMDKDRELAEEHLYFIENEYLVSIKDLYLPLLKNYSNMKETKNPLILYGGGKSKYIYLNGFEFVKKVESTAYDIIGTSYEEWCERVDNGENLLENDMLRFLSDNYPDYAENVIEETISYILESDNSENTERKKLINFGVLILIIMSLYIVVYGIHPLLNYSDKVMNNIVYLFKYLMKGILDIMYI
ncbi:hypothetical protein BCR36DRAFT_465081 [Piromyces finnis]|uniref:Uncharacterized protein n=1 Tax=Piromyces finnis TaxID=1754191 RepID=A0A1Y1VHN5_9FUNG|nr:hypothetical protein BCR36DRAFT_465081 [Piromyces finnis]|eukprot:ORX56533.1 hypothetical protein BCR36DRAFT_465081 [Piromyces finnis]